MSNISIEDQIFFLENLINEARRAGARDEFIAHYKAICANLRGMTEDGVHRAHRALAHQVQAAKRQIARLGYTPLENQQAIAQTTLAHWVAIQHALRERANKEEWEAAGGGR